MSTNQTRRTGMWSSRAAHRFTSATIAAAVLAILGTTLMNCTPNPKAYRQPQELIGMAAPALKQHSVGLLEAHDDLCTLRVIWATWCAPCKAELPAIDGWLESIGYDANVELVVADGANDEDVLQFLQDNAVTHGSYTRQQRTLGAHGVRGVPTAYLIDIEGIVAGVHEGSLTEATLRELLAAADCSPDEG